MFSTKVKALVFVFALLLFVGIFTVGCRRKPEVAWVNTKSMPGNTFSQYTNNSSSKNTHSGVIYLGGDSNSSNSNFGPRDVSFEFRDLR